MKISLKNLKFHARHGVLPEERILGNAFKVNLSVKIIDNDDMRNDRLEGTVSYADLFDIVKEEMEKPSELLEHVCIRIGNRIEAKYPKIHDGRVEITKLAPPVDGMIGEASVEYQFGTLPF